jgi:hypothetical protein
MRFDEHHDSMHLMQQTSAVHVNGSPEGSSAAVCIAGPTMRLLTACWHRASAAWPAQQQQQQGVRHGCDLANAHTL